MASTSVERHKSAGIPGERGWTVTTSEAMTTSNTVVLLTALIGVLALVATMAGLLWSGGDGAWTFTTYRGLEVELYGRGLYQHDTLFFGAGNRGADAVTLVIGIPLLAVATVLYRRGSLRGGLLLLGAQTWFVYVYSSYALAVALNDLFLVYVALFTASLWALILTARSFDVDALAARISQAMPRRALGIFLLASAAITLTIWLMEPLAALVTGDVPEVLQTWSTLFTNALDIAIIVPAVAVAGWLVLRGDALGYLIALPLLVLESLLAPMIVAQTISQLEAGYEFTTAEIVGPVAGFTVLAVLAIWFLTATLRNIGDTGQLVARS